MSTCPFYNKQCSLIAPCCTDVVCCHRCHDEAKDHALPRQLLEAVLCNNCSELQQLPKGGTCLNCGIKFAAYFCSFCGIANNDVPAEGYFHCDACGICRVGRRDEFFHCTGCGCCLRRHLQGDHICRRKALDAPCPICLDPAPMFGSRTPADMLPCGHFAHRKCIDTSASSISCEACRVHLSLKVASSSNGASSSTAAAAAAAGAGSSRGHSADSDSESDSDWEYQLYHTMVPYYGPSRASHSSSGYVKDMMDLLGGSIEDSEAAEVKSMLQELKQEELLPTREVKLYSAMPSLASARVRLATHPKQFRQHLEAAILNSVLITAAEQEAKGRAIKMVTQLLLQFSSSGSLQLFGRRVSIDRIVVAGSVGKSVSVQDNFDVDLVAFVNVPAGLSAEGVVVDLNNPDNTHNSSWMKGLQAQVCDYLTEHLPRSFSMRCISMPQLGRTAVKLSLAVALASSREVQLDVDVLLAPNMATGAGAAALAALGINLNCSTGSAADFQRNAVLMPVLAQAGSDINVKDMTAEPSFARNVWPTEATTEFTRQAWLATKRGGLPGRVLTSTIRLAKAWVRKGLAAESDAHVAGYKRLKSFMIELLVLHAAERLAARIQQKQQQQQWPVAEQFDGRYVLDLLLEVLKVVVDWADRASEASDSTTEPILFTELAGGRYYSRGQVLSLLRLGQRGIWGQGSGLFSVQPVVMHPVDPLCNVFAQEEQYRFRLWGEFAMNAKKLLRQLQECTWQEIMSDSSLGLALGNEVIKIPTGLHLCLQSSMSSIFGSQKVASCCMGSAGAGAAGGRCKRILQKFISTLLCCSGVPRGGSSA